MKRIPWDEAEPGHFEVDLVHHCGPSASGEYVHTLQMVDVTTGWSERVAVLGRSFRVMRAGFQRCLERLPFPVLEIHPDNGNEFFNHHLVRFFRDAVQGVDLSRSRPYRKNDNRNVEQKNSSSINNNTKDPKKLQIYGLDNCQSIDFKNSSDIHGVIYAPNADVVMHNSNRTYGAIVAKSLDWRNSVELYYDASLRDVTANDEAVKFVMTSWHEK